MKKLSAIKGIALLFLVVLYSLSTLGVFSSYVSSYHRSSFQLQVTKANRESLNSLELTENEFNSIAWTEAGREFEYMGKMYDVSKIERSSSGYLIYCENDSFEDLFFNWLKSESKSASKVIVQVQFIEPINYFECIPFALANEWAKNAFTNLYLSIEQELITPPPRIS